jgi:hypothetical protein
MTQVGVYGLTVATLNKLLWMWCTVSHHGRIECHHSKRARVTKQALQGHKRLVGISANLHGHGDAW